MLRITSKCKIISLLILVIFLFETAVSDLALAQPTIQTSTDKLSPQLRLSDDGPDPKYVALAEMLVSMELHLIDKFKNIDKMTSSEDIIKACRDVKKITRYETGA